MKNKYELRGAITAIVLKRRDGTSLETIVDTKDLPKADEFIYTWYACWNKSTESYYVVGNNKRKSVKLHRWLTEAPEGLQVDHSNHDTLDNRTSQNLVVCTQSENQYNRKGAVKGSKSSIRGAHYHKGTGKWSADVSINSKQKYLGLYNTPEEAGIIAKKVRNLEIVPKKSIAEGGLFSDNKSGYNGISWNKNASKWKVEIQLNKKRKHLGYFTEIEDAIKVLNNYIDKEVLRHGTSKKIYTSSSSYI